MNPVPPPNSEKTIFAQALALPAAARSEYLDQACGGNSDLRKGVEELLRAVNAVGFMAAPAAGLALTERAAQLPEEEMGKQIGRYKLLQKIGEGGCGTVYMAEQEEPVRRRVALKVIKLGMDTKDVIARFEAERQALAMMDHPNIAKVLEAGATDAGRPFFVMELVRGVPITKYCDEQRLTTAARLGLFVQVCHAIQHAHQKGIIHRDIKPSNILVTLHDGVPIPKVIDFGIAKATHGRLTDNTLFTAFAQFIGTPAYMSPEQAEMSSLDIDTRSDIYSLGVLLYELLTGRTPFEGKELMQAGLDEMRRQIREVEPQRPSTRLGTLENATLTTTAQHRQTDAQKLVNQVGGDLDWIVMRCLEKDRTRRYDTANSLADDIGRHLGNEPVTARPPSTSYRLGKAIRRNKVAFGAGAAIAASLAVGIIVATTAYLKEKAAHEFAVHAAVEQQGLIKGAWELNAKFEKLEYEARANDKKAKSEAARSAYDRSLLKDAFQGVAASPSPGSSPAQLLQTLDKTADRLSRNSEMSPEAKNDAYDTLGDVFMELGEFGRAEHMFREMLAVRRKLFGPIHPETVAALDKLIEALKRQGKSAEAEAELKSSQALQSEFLRTPAGSKYFDNLGRELSRQDRNEEALASFMRAREIDRNIRGERTHPLSMVTRFQAGDFSGAREMAMESLRTVREERWWCAIDENIRYDYDLAMRITQANLLLGRISLREGNLVDAKKHLLEAVQLNTGEAMNSYWLRTWMDLALPAELLAAGQRDAVIEFMDLLNKSAIESSRSSHTSRPWITKYELEAWERNDQAHTIDHWRQDVVAGRVPDDWKKPLNSPPLDIASQKPLSINQDNSPLVREASFLLAQLQYPLGFQMLGCVFVMPIYWRRSHGFSGLSRRAAAWLSVFGVLCLFEGALLLALFWGGFGLALRVNLQSHLLYELFALVVGTVLWEIGRALRDETAVGRTTLLLRLALVYLAVFSLLKAAFTQWTGLAPDFVYFMSVFFTPLLGVTSIGIILGVAWELWKWTRRNAALPSRAKWCLYLAAPVLGAQVVTSSWPILAGTHFISRPVALTALWLNVLLPWLLICGFVAARKQAGKTGPSPAAAAP